jgi:hypothetical protein
MLDRSAALRALLLGLALTSSIATSRVDPGDLRLYGLAALHNGGTEEIAITLANPATGPDCALLAEHPVLLDSIEWSDQTETTPLGPGQLFVPFERAPGGWTGWPSADCSVVRIDVEGVGPRILFAFGGSDGLDSSFPRWAELSDLGENVVSIVADSPQPFRPTSPDLLFEPGEPLAECRQALPIDVGCDDPLCVIEAIPDGIGSTYDGPSGTAPFTVGAVEERTFAQGICTDLVLNGEDGTERTARICGPDDIPTLPFAVGEPLEATAAREWTGFRLTLRSARNTVVFAQTTSNAPSGMRFAPAQGLAPECTDAADTCLSVGFEALDVSVVVGDGPASPGERVVLPDITPGEAHDFLIDLALAPEAETLRQENVSIWVDDARVPLSGDPGCGAPIDVLLVRSLREQPL